MSGTTSMTTLTRVAKLDTGPRSGPGERVAVVDVEVLGGERGVLGEDIPQTRGTLLPSLECLSHGRA